MFRNKPDKLITIITLTLLCSAASAETYYCKDTAGVSIDQFGNSSSAEDVDEFEQQDWVVNTEKGWRRSDIPGFSGACVSNKGYVVCKATDIAFGEATFSIHPNGSNFALVYTDFGLGALAFVGKCTKS